MLLPHTHYKKGFTLVEVVIATGIFSVALVAITSIFVFVINLQHKTQSSLEQEHDARFAMEVMAQAVRRNTIDYVRYGGTITAVPETDLFLISDDSAQIGFRRIENAGRGVIQYQSSTGAPWLDITPPGISVVEVKFFISPVTDPYALSASAPDIQPLVTMVVESESVEDPALRRVVLQSTISVRAYLR